jgi:hypothetical protein
VTATKPDTEIMSTFRWPTILLLAFALAAGGALLLQRQAAAQLRDELTLLREEQRELARLRTERARLQAVQPSPAELEQLRGDRAALPRLRDEVGQLRQQTQAMAQAAERAALPLTATASLGNAGRATPEAAMETLFWAAGHRDPASIAAMLVYDPMPRKAVDLLFRTLPDAARQKYGSIDGLVAQFTADELAVAAMRVVQQEPAGSTDGQRVAVVVRTQNDDGSARERSLVLVRQDEGWGVAVTPQMVQRIAERLLSEQGAGN